MRTSACAFVEPYTRPTLYPRKLSFQLRASKQFEESTEEIEKEKEKEKEEKGSESEGGDSEKTRTIAHTPGIDFKVKSIVCGSSVSALLDDKSNVWIWGTLEDGTHAHIYSSNLVRHTRSGSEMSGSKSHDLILKNEELRELVKMGGYEIVSVCAGVSAILVCVRRRVTS